MEIESSKQKKKFTVWTIQELLREFKNNNLTDDDKNLLKIEFHSRVKNRLYQYCQRLTVHNRYDDSVAKDIFQDTIIKAFCKISEFDFDYSVSDLKLVNKLFVWLNKIAFNLFLDFLKERNRVCYSEDLLEQLVEEDSWQSDFEVEEREDTNVVLQEAWDDLDDRERLIFYFCIKHNCLDNKEHLPDKVIEEICKTLKITKEYMRKIKSRAIKRLRSKFQ